MNFLHYFIAFVASAAALPQPIPQQTSLEPPSVQARDGQRIICISGQCLQGISNTSIGTTLSTTATNPPIQLLLLPDTYTSSSNPKLLNQLLITPGSTLEPSPGFEGTNSSNGVLQLPLTVTLGDGRLAVYSDRLYSGSARFTKPSASTSNNGTVISGVNSLALANGAWASLAGSGSSRVIVWSSVPDISQLPTSLSSSISTSGSSGSSFTLLDIQSSSCSPVCSSSGGVCVSSPTNSTGTCSCKPNFTGSSCEQCIPSHFGSDCQSQCDPGCPAGQCDDGVGGSGRCRVAIAIAGSPSLCNCLNGQCSGGTGSQCTCLKGWTTADNGTQCGKCAPGFFSLSSSTTTGSTTSPAGDQCKACALGCTACEDQTGRCLTCAAGYTANANNPTQCSPIPSTKAGGVQCPTGSFGTAQSSQCIQCDGSCAACNGPSSNDCLSCPVGSFMFGTPSATGGASCAKADATGVCAGSNGQLIGDNNKKVCDTCGTKCTQCQIPSFSPTTSTADQLKCTGCLPGSVLSNGACLDSCPTGTFLDPKDNVTCTACSSSCGTCFGSASFCTSCPQGSGLVAGTDGKCSSTSCPSGTFPPTSGGGQCGKCHPDCTTCSGPGFNQCLTCSSGTPVLNGGRCLPTCPSPTQFFDTQSNQCLQCDESCGSCSGRGKGACLSCPDGSNTVLKSGQCVNAQCGSNTSVLKGLGICLSDLVTVSSDSKPLPDPVIKPPSSRTTTRLEWWQILLMTLGCAFIFLCFLWCWRRRMRKGRKQATERFAQSRGLSPNGRSWWQRFREKVTRHRRPQYPASSNDHVVPMQKLYLSPSEPLTPAHEINLNVHVNDHRLSSGSSLSGPSLYSQLTGEKRRGGPEPRQPIRDRGSISTFGRTLSRYSAATSRSSMSSSSTDSERIRSPPKPETLQPMKTGGSGNSNNPFRKM